MDSSVASSYVRSVVLRLGSWIGLFFLGIAFAQSAGAIETRPFVPGDVLHRDFGTILETEGERGSDFLAKSGRIADPNDAVAMTFYRSSAQRMTGKATVLTFGDATWLVQELVGEFTAENGLAFKDGTVVAGDGVTRRFEMRRETPQNTARLIAWPSGPNRVIALDLTLRGGDRAADIPTDIVDAYLAAYPSSLPSDVVDTPKYHLEWMQREMDRLLAYAKRNLVLARSALGKPDSVVPTSEQYRLEAVRLLQRAVALRKSVYREGDTEAFAGQFQQAVIAAITPEMVLDKAKVLAFTDERLQELESWWQQHRDDW